MPVYLCKPGCAAAEPWRHGIQVYAFPFAIDAAYPDLKESSTIARTADTIVEDHHHYSNPAEDVRDQPESEPNHTTSLTQSTNNGVAIRRVRHAEVVLVDDVCISHGRHWLRLRWPGPRGGFAGYIALGAAVSPDTSSVRHVVSSNNSTRPLRSQPSEVSDGMLTPQEDSNAGYFAYTASTLNDAAPQDASEPQQEGDLRCIRTGLYYPSSSAMKIMALYDDGLSQTGNEPVFCRICREGLHDVENDDTPLPAGAADDAQSQEETVLQSNLTANVDEDDQVRLSDPTDPADRTAPELPPPTYHANNYATENPLLAPCECSGSMAFVHYLCVEQWRCRSRHPEARNGLNCETCGSAYALPPPSSRPTQQLPIQMEEDWLEAMPAHVLAALRQPHPFWQVGAAIVRRRWLRPIAPILISPLVALYCRARRLLKKRGVSRRRWACSLCRRRARWKCVRCLRSYYCSRQCQNVSWHIVHKHVCYKPARFWWSVVVYGAGTVAAFPGILKDPLIYDLGLTLIPASFLVMGILGGGVATAFKKGMGIDMRGRTLEFLVVLLTLWLVMVSWGLVWAFFGFEDSCHGVLGGYEQSADSQTMVLYVLRRVLFQPAQWWFLLWDRLAHNTFEWLRKGLCSKEDSCFAHVSRANPDFYFGPEGEKCASDLMLVVNLYMLAGCTLFVSSVLKKRDRLRRARGRHHRHPLAPRPHQD